MTSIRALLADARSMTSSSRFRMLSAFALMRAQVLSRSANVDLNASGSTGSCRTGSPFFSASTAPAMMPADSPNWMKAPRLPSTASPADLESCCE